MAAKRSSGSLRSYQQKRDFTRTGEPNGRSGEQARRSAGHALTFCVQKHAASRLHFDFRLELDGVLKSWSVPKGPSPRPGERRLAVHVEDHPLEYGTFEGVIPEKTYGGGTVIVWDQGTWTPEGDPRRAYEKGELVFELHGRRLRGRWRLVRMKGQAQDEPQEAWLLLKSRSGAAGALEEVGIDVPTSILSGRTLEDVAREQGGTERQVDRARKADGDGAPVEPEKPQRRAERAKAARRTKQAADARSTPQASREGSQRPRSPRRLKLPAGAKQAPLPGFVAPALATLVDQAPQGSEWLHEIKLDGYRMILRKQQHRVVFRSRNDKDWTARLGSLPAALARLGADEALLDGEVCAFTPDGRSSFERLKQLLGEGASDQLVVVLFDLLHLDGHDLRPLPLRERKRLLAQLLGSLADDERVRYSEHVEGHGPRFHAQACELGLEGVIAKRAEAPYRSGRGRDWLKLKCQARQEFVIAGYTPPAGSNTHLGALALGVYEGRELRYVGRVGTGFDARQRAHLAEQLDRRRSSKSPFAEPPRDRGLAGARWAKPELVAEVEFTEWTKDGRLRHPSFKGLREDKPARAIRREQPLAVGAAKDARSAATPARGVPQARRERGTPMAGRTSDETSFAGVRLTNPGRVLYPDQGLTKRDLCEHYAAVAERMLPHLERRPLTLVRCPQGTQRHCFYQKHVTGTEPDVVRRLVLPHKAGEEPYMEVRDLAGIIALVQLGTLELHVWGSRSDRLERPDRMVIDLDPAEGLGFEQVVQAARELRARLHELDLESFALATGGKGLHVVVPLTRHHDFDQVKRFSGGLAKEMTRAHPERFLAQASKQKRRGKIFVDYLRNARGATAICPFSTRSRPGAPVATPLRWDELEPGLDPAGFTVQNLGARLARGRSDPWKGYFELRQRLSATALRELGGAGP